LPRFVAFLASVNVGGNRVAMADLRGLLEEAGYGAVETVVASGNVLFSHDDSDAEAHADRIGALVAERFAIRTWAAVLTREQLAAAIADNPFHGDGEDRFVHSIFLSGQPSRDSFEALLAEHASKGSERLALGPRVLYLDYVHGAGVSSLTGAFLERRLGCKGTARNMRSLKRILEKMT
jgi:uncharacterized protein (DUF1697 family)